MLSSVHGKSAKVYLTVHTVPTNVPIRSSNGIIVPSSYHRPLSELLLKIARFTDMQGSGRSAELACSESDLFTSRGQ